MIKSPNSKKTNPITKQMIDQVTELTNQPYNQPYTLSFSLSQWNFENPLQSSIFNRTFQTNDKAISFLSLSQGKTSSKPLQNELKSTQGPEFDAGAQITQSIQQKNQIVKAKKIKKEKPIRKSRRPEKDSDSQSKFSDDQEMIIENSQPETKIEQGIRDQNNCKTYHKLVKNYLLGKNLDHLIERYDYIYHTRYYFIVALIIIKYNLTQDFNEVYKRISSDEITIQQRKIVKKKKDITTIEENIRFRRGDLSALLLKKHKLEKQISHLRIVKNEISRFSVDSCAAFFQGKTQESLRILYLKNDLVMKKKYYFKDALEFVKKIQQEVRECSPS